MTITTSLDHIKGGTILCSETHPKIGKVPSDTDRSNFIQQTIADYKAIAGNENKAAFGSFGGWEAETRDIDDASGNTYALGYCNIIVVS